MTTTYGFDIARPRSRGARIARIDALATLLDTALVIPGTGVRFGLDALIGLFPVVGDAITTALSLFIVHEAYQLGVPGRVVSRMLANERSMVYWGGAIGRRRLRCDVARKSAKRAVVNGMAGARAPSRRHVHETGTLNPYLRKELYRPGPVYAAKGTGRILPWPAATSSFSKTSRSLP